MENIYDVYYKWFTIKDMSEWTGFSVWELARTVQILEKRGIIKKPELRNRKLEIIFPKTIVRDSAIAQAEIGAKVTIGKQASKKVYAPGKRESSATKPANKKPEVTGEVTVLKERLEELMESENVANKRIGRIISQFQQEGRIIFKSRDWEDYSGVASSTAGKDIVKALSLGLLEKVNRREYSIKAHPVTGTRWEDLTMKTCQILDNIIRSFGEKAFLIVTRQKPSAFLRIT